MKRHPFEGASDLLTLVNIVNKEPHEMSELIAKPVRKLILSMLSKDPKARPVIMKVMH